LLFPTLPLFWPNSNWCDSPIKKKLKNTPLIAYMGKGYRADAVPGYIKKGDTAEEKERN
jgi:hypothetical protein